MKSEQIDKLAAALNKAQGQIKAAVKDKENPFYHSKYATLGAVWEACRDALISNGLSVVQGGTEINGKPVLTTTLIHNSGQWISGDFILMPTKQDPQALGSAYSYARRYALAAMVGVVTEDDDAESATDHGRAPAAKEVAPGATKATEPVSQPKPISDTRKTTFIPDSVKPRTDKSKKTGKEYTAYDIINPDGIVFSTLDETMGQAAMTAEANKTPIIVHYVQNGKFYNAVKIEQAELENVPF